MESHDRPRQRPPIGLIVTAQEWVSLSMETLFSPRGYAVLRAFTGAQALQRVSEFQPDLLLVDKDLRDMRGIDLCRTLRDQDRRWSATPVMVTATSPWSRDERLDALRSGAWDTCALPLDGEELFLRVDAWVRAKLAADEVQEQGLLDAATGLYNAQGLLRRIVELAALAGRRRAALACVVISSEGQAVASTTVLDSTPWTNALALRLRAAGRASDTIGRLSDTEFVVVAPDTDADGALGLAHRLKEAMEGARQEEEAGAPMRLRFGCYAVSNFRDASIAPSELLIRAAEALRGAGSERTGEESIRLFTPPIPGVS